MRLASLSRKGGHPMKVKGTSALLIATGLGLLPIVQPASAEEAEEVRVPDHPMMKDRFFIAAGALYADSNVTANLNSGRVGLGAIIDFEDDLGLEESSLIAMGTFRWRISRRFQIEAEYFSLNRDNTKQVNRTIDWGGISLPVNAEATSTFDIDDFRVGIGYSFFRSKDKEIGIGLGAHVMSMKAGIETANQGSQRASESAPLPFLNMYGRFALTDRWLFSVRIDRLSLDTGDIDGKVFSSGTDFIYQPWRHVGIGLGYRDINFQVSSTSDKWRGKAQIQQTGPYLFISGTF